MGRCFFKVSPERTTKPVRVTRVSASGFPVGLHFDGDACRKSRTYLIYINYGLLSPLHNAVNKKMEAFLYSNLYQQQHIVAGPDVY
jgi:hypothetical protein